MSLQQRLVSNDDKVICLGAAAICLLIYFVAATF